MSLCLPELQDFSSPSWNPLKGGVPEGSLCSRSGSTSLQTNVLLLLPCVMLQYRKNSPPGQWLGWGVNVRGLCVWKRAMDGVYEQPCSPQNGLITGFLYLDSSLALSRNLGKGKVRAVFFPVSTLCHLMENATILFLSQLVESHFHHLTLCSILCFLASLFLSLALWILLSFFHFWENTVILCIERPYLYLPKIDNSPNVFPQENA